MIDDLLARTPSQIFWFGAFHLNALIVGPLIRIVSGSGGMGGVFVFTFFSLSFSFVLFSVGSLLEAASSGMILDAKVWREVAMVGLFFVSISLPVIASGKLMDSIIKSVDDQSWRD